MKSQNIYTLLCMAYFTQRNYFEQVQLHGMGAVQFHGIMCLKGPDT